MRFARALGVTPKLLERGGRTEGGIAVGAHMRRRATAKPTVWRELEARLNVEVAQLARHIAESLRSRGLSDDEIADLAGYSPPEVNMLFPRAEKSGWRLQLV